MSGTIRTAFAVAAAVAVVDAGVCASDDLLFNAPATATSGNPRALATGDFNGDGLPDFLTTHVVPSIVKILLGQGDGRLAVSSIVPIVDSPEAVVVGDLDLDGAQDVAIAGMQLTTLLGDGYGGFEVHGSYGLLGYPPGLVIGEFNEDGRPDIATASNVSVFLGHADGSFTYGGAFGVGYSANAVAVGDFNGDGHQDLATVGSPDNTVQILGGDGHGAFVPGNSYFVPPAPRGLVVGDFDGDGAQDLATANSMGTGTVSVLLGHGDSTFTVGTTAPGSIAPGVTGIALGDFDGNGAQDLVTSAGAPFPSYDGGMSVLLGQGDGTFAANGTFTTGMMALAVGVADFDGDGAQDLATSTFAPTAVVLRGDGHGRFGTNVAYDVGRRPASVIAADFNGDAVADLATANANDTEKGVSILLGHGDGSYAPAVAYGAVGTLHFSVAPGDFNGDGATDLATTTVFNPIVEILMGRGDGTFVPGGAFVAGPNARYIAAGDFDGDGNQDLATLNIVVNTVSILLGDGNGGFGAATTYVAGSDPAAIVVGEFNDDGHPDLALGVAGPQGVALLLGVGGGSFTEGGSVTTGSDSVSLATGDLDADGEQDLVTADAAGAATVLRGLGNGRFAVAASVPGVALVVAVADIDGDGAQDVVTADSFSTVSLLLGNGMGELLAHEAVAVQEEPLALAVADLDGNGKTDVAVSGGEYASPGRVSILLNQAPGAWVHVDAGLAGIAGIPSLLGAGTLRPGSAGALTLIGAASSAPSMLFVSRDAQPVPFKCGLLVPSSLLLALPLPTDASGRVALTWVHWPTGLFGASLYWQFGVADDSAPCGVSLSTALKSNVP